MRVTGIALMLVLVSLAATLSCSGGETYSAAVRPAVDRELLRQNQEKTAAAIAALGEAVDAYILEFPAIGAPKCSSSADLIQALAQAKIPTDNLSATDAWGNLIQYQNWYSPRPRDRNDYSLLSPGEDGARELFAVTEFINDSNQAQDIIWRRITGVYDRGVFTAGPSFLRERFADRVGK